ncbi:MAG: ribonuclease III [Eubacterium sp.]|jgi:ribonuclease-3|nr:ribonuclease III [Eubacterium sp.]
MSDLFKKINYEFKNKNLFTEAMTHSSSTGGVSRSNERLEFLGDSVLSVIVSDFLFRALSDLPEGQLTKTRAGLVCEQSLYNFAKQIGLGEEIILGKGEENTGGRYRKSILSDAFEALLAAIYLDGGVEAAREFLLPFMPTDEELKNGSLIMSDYKTVLQEIIQKNPEEKITYSLVNETGAAHNREFTSQVLLNGQIIGTGKGPSKKQAEQMAAHEAIKLMGYE